MAYTQPNQLPAPTLDSAALPAAQPPVVAVGALAGGPQALCTLPAAQPADFPAPIVIALHLSPDFPSRAIRTAGGVTFAQDEIHDPLLILDRNLCVKLANSSYCKMF